ncbi:MAG: hypothetical protein HY078_11580 [Elusimicrobia bacterium]|nr:hypothetical protein [Elusimicrobiota bacterium]
MKKKSRPASAPKKSRTAAKEFYPDNDPEWEHLEERYSTIGDDMRKLASLLTPATDIE